MKITDEMFAAIGNARTVKEEAEILAPFIIAQYEAEKAAAAAPFEITSLDQKVQFRDGTPARLLAVDLISIGAPDRPVLAYHKNGMCYRTDSNGRMGEIEGRFDLIPIPPAERVAYVNVYADSAYGMYTNRANANNGASGDRTGCNRIVLKEGVWDE